jgi:hypothetical protein
MFHFVMNTSLISNSIMYKTWNNPENRKILNKILDNFPMIKDDSSNEEIKILNDLCDHECIHQDMKYKLNLIFNK